MNRNIRQGLWVAIMVVGTAASAGAHEGHEHAAPPPAAPSHGHADHADHANHEDHDHPSPHGGIVATVDRDTHMEALFTDAEVSVWFYDAEMKPLAPPTDAKATLVVGKDVKKMELPVMKNPDGTLADHLLVALASKADQKITVVVQATVAGKSRSGRIERAAITHAPVTMTPAPAAPVLPATPPSPAVPQ